LVSQVDFFASLTNLVKGNIPTGSAPDSQNHLKALLGKTATGRKSLIEQNVNSTLSVVAGEWKYIEPSKGTKMIKETNTELGNIPEDQLYNLKTDCAEIKNIATENKDRVQKLKTILQVEKAKTAQKNKQ
jgi:arylsulfatase A